MFISEQKLVHYAQPVNLEYTTWPPGPRDKIIILNISPESGLRELNFFFMSLVITVKWQLFRYLSCN